MGSLAAAWSLAASKVMPAKLADANEGNSVQSPKIDSYCHFSSMGIINYLDFS